jgi:hypothetical protein
VTTGIESTEPLSVVKLAAIHPRAVGFVGSAICHQSLAAVRPMTCTVCPLVKEPICCAAVEGAARTRKFSVVVAVTGAGGGGGSVGGIAGCAAGSGVGSARIGVGVRVRGAVVGVAVGNKDCN